MKELFLTTFDNAKLYVSAWDEVENPKGAVLIAHGMAEHSGRYDSFAQFLNKNGYIVIADDERGHRFSSTEKGAVNGDSFLQTIRDKKMLLDYIKKEYNLKVFLLGHSYGSFVSQGFIEAYSDSIVGCILSGTAHMKNILTKTGSLIANFQNVLFDANKPAKLIDKMSFASYAKPFAEENSKFAWLSRDRKEVEKYENDEYCGHMMSLGFYKSFFKGVNNLYGERAKGIDKNLPILIAVGSCDPVSQNAKLARKLFQFYKTCGLNVSIKIYDKARHEILNEINKNEVYLDMLKFIDASYEAIRGES